MTPLIQYPIRCDLNAEMRQKVITILAWCDQLTDIKSKSFLHAPKMSISHIYNYEGVHSQGHWGVNKVHPCHLHLERPAGSVEPSEPSVLQHLFLLSQRFLRFFIDFAQRLERHSQKYQEPDCAIKVNHPNEAVHFDYSIYAANDTKQVQCLQCSQWELDSLICPFL